jgi:hypothetical protein
MKTDADRMLDCSDQIEYWKGRFEYWRASFIQHREKAETDSPMRNFWRTMMQTDFDGMERACQNVRKTEERLVKLRY